MGEVKSTGSGDSIRRPDRERCFLQLECILKVRQEQRISGVQIDTHHKSYFQIEKVIVHGYKTFSTLKYSEDLICLVRGCFLFRKQPLTKQIRSSEYMVWVCVKKFNVKKTVFRFRRGFWLVHWQEQQSWWKYLNHFKLWREVQWTEMPLKVRDWRWNQD